MSIKKVRQKKIKILHIEDDREFAEATAFLLGDGYQVEIMEAADEAIEKIKDYKPNMIFLDLNLQSYYTGALSMEGIALLNIIKSEHDTKDIPVIVITNNSNETIKQACLKLGADCYFRKPVPIKEVIQAIDKILSKGD